VKCPISTSFAHWPRLCAISFKHVAGKDSSNTIQKSHIDVSTMRMRALFLSTALPTKERWKILHKIRAFSDQTDMRDPFAEESFSVFSGKPACLSCSFLLLLGIFVTQSHLHLKATIQSKLGKCVTEQHIAHINARISTLFLFKTSSNTRFRENDPTHRRPVRPRGICAASGH
jgi:hypothetical protein